MWKQLLCLKSKMQLASPRSCNRNMLTNSRQIRKTVRANKALMYQLQVVSTPLKQLPAAAASMDVLWTFEAQESAGHNLPDITQGTSWLP